MELLFWASSALLVYSYAGYPALLWLVAKFTTRSEPVESGLPTIAIVVAAYNERRFIADKIRNALSCDYPSDRVRVIVVSDGSTNGTAEIARGIPDPRLTVLEIPERGGKAGALNRALEGLNSEIAVFTDANVLLSHSALRELVRPFADPGVGCVSGNVELVALEDGEPLGEGAYMRYERFLYRRESDLGSMIGTDGALFACRAGLVAPLPHGTILDDYLIGMRVIAQGYSIRYQPSAHGVERVPASVRQEFRRKVRIAAGAFQALPHLTFMARPWRRPREALFFISHKLLRWFSPFLILAAFTSTLILSDRPLYGAAFLLQSGVLALALLGGASLRSRQLGVVYVPYYFGAMNLAFLLGFFRWLLRRESGAWRRVDR